MKKLAVALMVLLAHPAWAAMSLDKMIIHLDAIPNAREDIVVSNPDQETLYLQTEVFRVDNPGTEKEVLQPVTNPEDFKLLISPSKAVIPVGGKKRFRLMSVETGLEKEKVYRITFKPVVGDITTEATGLKLLVAFQTLIFVQPVGGHYRLELEKSDGKLFLKNTGNVNVEITKVRHCEESGKCAPLSVGGRLYVDTRKTVPLEGGGGYLEVQAFDGAESETFKLTL